MTPGRRLAPLKRELAELVVGLHRSGLFSSGDIAVCLGYTQQHVNSILRAHGRCGLTIDQKVRALPAQLRRRLGIWQATNVSVLKHSPSGAD